MVRTPFLLVTGASGRVGQCLQRVWSGSLPGGLSPLWQMRHVTAPGFLGWDILNEPFPAVDLRGGVVLHLAGATRGDVAQNAALALRVCQAAAEAGVRHVFVASTAAVYGPGTGRDFHEDDLPQPINPYGLAKAAMERQVLEWQAAAPGRPGLTILRIGNVLGCDALIGAAVPGQVVTLDPVAGGAGGPVRSYIGPRSLALALASLAGRALRGDALPPVLNIAADPPVAMADLLDAAGMAWQFGPPNPAVVPRVVLATDLLRRLVVLPPEAGQATAMVAEWRDLGGMA